MGSITVRANRILKSKWLWPLWFVLVCVAIYRGWQEVMARPCSIVWSPNKQFKIEYYFYGYVPVWYEFRKGVSFGSRWPGFIRITDKNGHTIERRDEDGMGLYCDTCIGIQAHPIKLGQAFWQRQGCTGNEKPDVHIGDLLGSGHVVWEGRPQDSKEKWLIAWKNWYNGSADNIDIITYLPAPPLDK